MYGSAIRSILIVALFNLTKVPLLICLKRNNSKTLRTFGATLLILKAKICFEIKNDCLNKKRLSRTHPRIRMTNANLG